MIGIGAIQVAKSHTTLCFHSSLPLARRRELDMSKSAYVDLSHHLSDEAKNMKPSPLKGMYKYWGMPGLVNLAGGIPHPSLFPYETMSAEVLPPTAFSVGDSGGILPWLWSAFKNKKSKTQITIPKYANPEDGPSAIQLSTALQYSMVAGLPAFVDFVRNFTLKVFQPACSDFRVLANSGNTDGWAKACALLCQPGEFILTEDWTYPGALLAAWPSGVRPYPIPMDSLGMIPGDLERILSEWKEENHEGKRRPHVMYTIPIGQNPTGAVMNVKRKQDIYDICVKYDIIIVEDDPYYFLQYPEYKRKSERSLRSHIPGKVSPETSREFLKTLAPSYLRIDHQGRVIRLDTFSKTIGPGCRLGWTTCNPLFATIMENYSANKTNQTSGISQALVMQLVSKQWGYDGLHSLVERYWCTIHRTTRPNVGFPLRGIVFRIRARTKQQFITWRHCSLPSREKVLFSFSIPNGGMFLWIKFHLKNHRDWVPHPAPGSALDVKLWTDLVEAGVMFAPGYMFSTDENDTPTDESVGQVHLRSEYTYMRVSFSSASKEEITKAMKTFVEVTLRFFQ
ncbi:hypothetical protein OPQ81_004383 [Rhizoctonia solani]|nr:hypothetical protein OPQ81_004383 [Rhizoctonia solani]